MFLMHSAHALVIHNMVMHGALSKPLGFVLIMHKVQTDYKISLCNILRVFMTDASVILFVYDL